MADSSPVPALIVATAVLPLVQVPPPASVKLVDVPEHSSVVPEMAEGAGLMVIVLVALQPVGSE
jgi:hypothetical protein